MAQSQKKNKYHVKIKAIGTREFKAWNEADAMTAAVDYCKRTQTISNTFSEFEILDITCHEYNNTIDDARWACEMALKAGRLPDCKAERSRLLNMAKHLGIDIRKYYPLRESQSAK
jgi:hypothetical protein|tara:strand:- start:17 stop:364 length:348 start_codon:yes stop_codon:yes gene_type:complete